MMNSNCEPRRCGTSAGEYRPEPPRAAEGAAGEPDPQGVRIRVVDTKVRPAGLLSVTPEELAAALEDIAEKEGRGSDRQVTLAFGQQIEALRALQHRGARPSARPGEPPAPEGMIEIALRLVLNAENVTPRVAKLTAPRRTAPPWGARAPGRKAGPAGPGIYVRPGIRKEGRTPDGAAAGIAAEDGARVVGLEVGTAPPGGLFRDVFAGGVDLGRTAALASGNFTAPLMSVAEARRHPGRGPGPAEAAAISLTDPTTAVESLSALRALLAAIEDHHMSGIAGLLAAEAYAAKRTTPPPRKLAAPPAPLLAIAPERGPQPRQAAPGRLAQDYLLAQYAEIDRAGANKCGDSELARLGELNRRGALAPGGPYYSVLVGGRGSPAAAQHLAEAAAAQAASDNLAGLAARAFAETARARQYVGIVEDKLGAGRAAELSQSLGPAGDDPERVLERLGPRERSLVATEYDNRKKEWDAQLGNRCPHVQLALRLRTAPTAAGAERIRRELAGYYAGARGAAARAGPRGAGGTPDDEWILCRSCGFRVVCPHVDELVAMDAKGLAYDGVRERLMKYRVRYAGADDRYTFFCRICGERLAEFVAEDRTSEILGAVGRLGDGLRRAIWSEALSAAAFIRFAVPTDPRTFAGAAADVCHPLLLRAEAGHQGRRAPPASAGRGGSGDLFEDEEGPLDPRTRLYAALLAYAYAFDYIRAGAAARTLAGRAAAAPGFDGVRPGAQMSAYAGRLLAVLSRERGGVIARVTDVTPGFIADRFREAVRAVAAAGGAAASPAPTPLALVDAMTTVDPTYGYAVVAAQAFGAIPRGPPSSPKAARAEFEAAVGKGLMAQLLQGAPTSDLGRVLLGLRPGGGGGRRIAIEYPAGLAPEYVYMSPDVNLYFDLYRPPALPGHSAAAFAAFAPPPGGHPGVGGLATYVGGRRALRAPGGKPQLKKPPGGKPRPKKPPGGKPQPKKPPARATGGPAAQLVSLTAPRGEDGAAADPAYFHAAYRLFRQYTTELSDRAGREAYDAERARAAELEKGYLLARAAGGVKNLRHMNVVASEARRKFDPELVNRTSIAAHYDEDGRAHVWSQYLAMGRTLLPRMGRLRLPPPIFVYRGAAGPVELTGAEVAARIAAAAKAGEGTPALRGLVLSDRRCPVCGILQSETGSLDTGKVQRSLAVVVEFAAFFAHYSVRCPAGGLHEFGKKGRCVKCGLLKAVGLDPLTAENSAAARAYFDKFFGAYDQDRAAVGSFADFVGAHVEPPGAPDEGLALWAREWTPDYGVLIRAASAGDTSVTALEALGATEGRKYEDVLAGKGAPPLPERSDDPRLYAADAAVRAFVSEYNRLRNAALLPKPSPAIADLLRETEVPPQELGQLTQWFPDVGKVFGSYIARRRAILEIQGAARAYQFSVETLAGAVLATAAPRPGPAWAERLGAEFALRALAGLLRGSRLLSLPDRSKINFALLFGGEDFDAGDGGEDSKFGVGEVGDAGEDAIADAEAAGDASEDGIENPFALSAVDIDTPENLE